LSKAAPLSAQSFAPISPTGARTPAAGQRPPSLPCEPGSPKSPGLESFNEPFAAANALPYAAAFLVTAFVLAINLVARIVLSGGRI
jgi:hypothetical protein